MANRSIGVYPQLNAPPAKPRAGNPDGAGRTGAPLRPRLSAAAADTPSDRDTAPATDCPARADPWHRGRHPGRPESAGGAGCNPPDPPATGPDTPAYMWNPGAAGWSGRWYTGR